MGAEEPLLRERCKQQPAVAPLQPAPRQTRQARLILSGCRLSRRLGLCQSNATAKRLRNSVEHGKTDNDGRMRKERCETVKCHHGRENLAEPGPITHMPAQLAVPARPLCPRWRAQPVLLSLHNPYPAFVLGLARCGAHETDGGSMDGRARGRPASICPSPEG